MLQVFRVLRVGYDVSIHIGQRVGAGPNDLPYTVWTFLGGFQYETLHNFAQDEVSDLERLVLPLGIIVPCHPVLVLCGA